MRLVFIVLLVQCLTLSCAPRFIKVDNAFNKAQYLEQIASYNQAVQQIKATLDIKAYGVLKSVVHEQADIVVQSPHYLYWSLRSFFGPPSMVLAADGNYLTMVDYGGTNPKRHQKMALKPNSFFELMDFRFHPQSLIDILLAKIAINETTIMRAADGKIEVETQMQAGWSVRALFDQEQGRLIETFISNDGAMVSFHAKYDKFNEEENVFPHSIVLVARGKHRFLRLNIQITNIELNGAPMSPQFFHIEQH